MFSSSSSGAPGTGGASALFPALNLAVPTFDAGGRKRSIFDTGSSAGQPTFPSASTTTAPPSILINPPTASPNPFPFAGTSTATSTPSLFAPKPALSNPFGASTTTPAATNTTFPTVSGLGTQPQSTGIFGNPSQQQQQQQHQGQAGQAQQQSQAPGPARDVDSAHFRSLLERQKNKPGLSSSGQNGRFNALPGLNVDLGDLARKAQEIGGRASKAPADSRAHYLLAGSGVSPGKAYKDFQALEDEKSEERRQHQEPLDVTAGRYMQDFQQKGREVMMKESMERVHREVDTFIQDSLGIDFEEHKRRIMEHFGLVPKEDDTTNDGHTGSFGRSPKKDRGAFAESAKGSTRSVFGRSALEKSLIGRPGLTGSTASFFGEESDNQAATNLSKGQTARDLRDKERLYIEQVGELNRARQQQKVYPIMQQFAQVEDAAGGDSPRQLFDAFCALAEISKEVSSAGGRSDPPVIKERQYASTYFDERHESPGGMRLKKQILDGSRTHLEKAFYRDLEALVEKNPREAQLGGRPTVANKVRAYIRVRAARHDLAPDGAELQQIGEDGDYCWILIFYLLRTGHIRDALEYVENESAFQATDKRFIAYLKSYNNNPDRLLTRKLQEMIQGEYLQRSKIATQHAVDPYRVACYKIVGRCDLSSRNLDIIGQGVEDWIWLQFNLAREQDRLTDLSAETFGLDQICETITEIGQKHFQKGQAESSGGYGTFLLMQILAGMFEQAVEYLHSYNPVSAVHFAIALAYYGLLRVSDYTVAGNELLTYSTTSLPQINFVPLLAYYTAAFRTALPVSAVDYLALICLNSDLKPASLGNAQTAACHECLRQLCLETREFARLLGDIRGDGTRLPGAIEEKASLIKIETREDFLKAVTIQAAAIANERGQIADAVLLYHLSEDYDNVVGILNRALADAVCVDLGESPMQLQPLKPRRRHDQGSPESSRSPPSDGPQSSLSLTQSTSSPVELASNIMALYDSNATYYKSISETNRTTCSSLRQLLIARALLEARPPQYLDALSELNNVDILPLQANGSIPLLRSAATKFGNLQQLLARCAGVSIVWAVRAIGGERERRMKHGNWSAGGNSDQDSMKEQLNSMAKDLMVFAGLVRYKLPNRVYEMLTKAGGDVGMY